MSVCFINASVKESEEELDKIFCTDDTFGYSSDDLYEHSSVFIDIFSSIKNTLSKQSDITRTGSQLPPKDPSAPSHTLVLDLDDTLIHNVDPQYEEFVFDMSFTVLLLNCFSIESV